MHGYVFLKSVYTFISLSFKCLTMILDLRITLFSTFFHSMFFFQICPFAVCIAILAYHF